LIPDFDNKFTQWKFVNLEILACSLEEQIKTILYNFDINMCLIWISIQLFKYN